MCVFVLLHSFTNVCKSVCMRNCVCFQVFFCLKIIGCVCGGTGLRQKRLGVGHWSSRFVWTSVGLKPFAHMRVCCVASRRVRVTNPHTRAFVAFIASRRCGSRLLLRKMFRRKMFRFVLNRQTYEMKPPVFWIAVLLLFLS